MRRLSPLKLALMLGSFGRTALPAHAADLQPLPILADRLPSQPAPLVGGAASRPSDAFGHYLACEPLSCDRKHALRRIKTLAAAQ